MNVVGEADGKTIIKSQIPIETLSKMLQAHGEPGVKDTLMEMWRRIADDLKKPSPKA